MGCQSWKIATSCQAKGLLFVLCARIYSNTCTCMTYVALKNGYGHSSIYNMIISKIQSCIFNVNCSIRVIVLCAVKIAQIQHACNTHTLFFTKDFEGFLNRLSKVRSGQMGPLSTASLEQGSYQRGYEYIVR